MNQQFKRPRGSLIALLLALLVWDGCESTESGGNVSSSVYYGVGFYDPWYYGSGYYPPDVIVGPPPNRPGAPPSPSHPIATPPVSGPRPTPMPSIPSAPRGGGGRR
jgi:hypothetical protein